MYNGLPLPKRVKEAETCGQWTAIQYQQLKKIPLQIDTNYKSLGLE